MSTFTDDEITAALEDLPGWSADGDAITKTYEFADFRAALDFEPTTTRSGPVSTAVLWTRVVNRVGPHHRAPALAPKAPDQRCRTSDPDSSTTKQELR